MTERLKVILHNRQQARQVLHDVVYPFLAQNLQAERRLCMTIRPATRSLEQNARLHASIADIARQKEWGGKRWSIEEWKRLLCAAWCRANAQGVEMVPAIDGQGFDVLYQRTSKLTKAECADLLDYVYAWGADNGVVFTDPVPQEWAE